MIKKVLQETKTFSFFFLRYIQEKQIDFKKNSDVVMTNENWRDYLGKCEHFTSYVDFFDQKEKEIGKYL